MHLKIKNLKAQTILGIYEHEQQALREVIINITMEFDGTKAAVSDNIADTIDYDIIETNIIERLKNSRYGLIERLVAEIAAIVKQDNRIINVEVAVDKPGALKNSESVSVTYQEFNDQ